MNSSEQLSSSSCFHVAWDFCDLGSYSSFVLLYAENLTYLVIEMPVYAFSGLTVYFIKKKEIWEKSKW